MTYDEILALPLRRLDALIAETIEGHSIVWAPEPYRLPDRRLADEHPWLMDKLDCDPPVWKAVARYSTEWTTVQQLICAMADKGLWCQLRTPRRLPNGIQSMYEAVFLPDSVDSTDDGALPYMVGSDAPIAIARAAILAFGLHYSHWSNLASTHSQP